MNMLQPDIDHARQFLEMLDADPSSFTFQTFAERTGSKEFRASCTAP